MLLFLTIAWRNITRNLYRSSITIAAIAIGFASLLFIRAFVDGAHRQMVANYTDLISGHIQVHAQGFRDEMGLARSITGSAAIEATALSVPGVEAVAPRIKDYVLASSASHSAGSLLMGIDPKREGRVTKLMRRIRPGAAPSSPDDIAIGKDMAKSLKVALGDKIVIMAQGYDGSLASGAYRVSGLIDTGTEEIDRSLALITIEAADELLVMGGRVSEIVIRTKTVDDAKTVVEALRKEGILEPLEILGWSELSPIIVQWIAFDIAFIAIILAIVLAVVAAGILNTLLMGILERTREFGIMLALGTARSQIVTIVAFESVLLGAVGIACGYFTGGLAVLYCARRGIDLSVFSAALNDYYTGSVIYPCASVGFMVEYGLIVFLTCLAVSVYPAWRAAHLDPVEAIYKV